MGGLFDHLRENLLNQQLPGSVCLLDKIRVIAQVLHIGIDHVFFLTIVSTFLQGFLILLFNFPHPPKLSIISGMPKMPGNSRPL